MQCGRAAHKWICYHGAPRGVRRRIRLMQRPGRGIQRGISRPGGLAARGGDGAGAAVSARVAGTGRTATARSTRRAIAGSWCGARCSPQGGSPDSAAAAAGALVHHLVHASLRMRGQTSTPACGRGGVANSADGSRLARAGRTAVVRALRENRRAVAYQPESQVQPPGRGHAR